MFLLRPGTRLPIETVSLVVDPHIQCEEYGSGVSCV